MRCWNIYSEVADCLVDRMEVGRLCRLAHGQKFMKIQSRAGNRLWLSFGLHQVVVDQLNESI